jgi:hypothetical protein
VIFIPLDFRLTELIAGGLDDEGDGIGQGDEEDEEEAEMERNALTYADHAFEFSLFELVR